MIGIIVALKSESENYLTKIKDKKHQKIAGKDFYTFTIHGKQIVYAISGIGKVNAAMTTQVMIDKFSPKRIINYGSAGGLNGKVKALDFYCIEKCCQYDFDLSPLDPVPVGYIQDYDKVYFELNVDGLEFLRKATLATSDRFTCKSQDIEQITKMNCSIFDMEAGAIAETCEANAIPFSSIKGISDVNGSGIQPKQYVENFGKLFERFTPIIDTILQNI